MSRIFGRYFSCLCCCLLFYHVVLWWAATLGKEKREKTQTIQTFPHILPFIWASFSRLLIEKRRVLSEIFLFVFSLATPCSVDDYPDQGSNPHSLHWWCSLNDWTTREALSQSFCCLYPVCSSNCKSPLKRKEEQARKCTPKWIPFPSFDCPSQYSCSCLSFRVRSCLLHLNTV